MSGSEHDGEDVQRWPTAWCPSSLHVLTDRSSCRGEQGGEINRALVRSALKPLGGTAGFALWVGACTAGWGTLDGPLLWRIEAEGDGGYHKGLTVHRMKVETKITQRKGWDPQSLLRKTVEFHPVKGSSGEVVAQYLVPGELEVFPDEDGDITIVVDLTGRAVEVRVRKMVRFRMARQQSRDFEDIFLPALIVKGKKRDPKARNW